MRLTTTEVSQSTGARCERIVERTARGFRRIMGLTRCGTAAYRPRRLSAACVLTAGPKATQLRWRGWNQDVVTGRGRWHRACVPRSAYPRSDLPYPPAVSRRTQGREASCPASRPARFRLSRIRWCNTLNTYLYTRLRVRPRGRPSSVVRLACPRPAVGDG